MERSIETKIFFVSIVFTVFFFVFCSSRFIQQIESILLRVVLLASCSIFAIICILPAWMYNKYDCKKICSYVRFFPYKDSPYIKYRETLIFREIKAVKYESGGDSGSTMRLLLHNGKTYDLEIGSISNKSINIFFVTLYEECEWLRGNIENEFGPIERRKMYAVKNVNRHDFNIFHILIHVFLIWVILIDIIGLIIFTLKIRC